MKAPILVGIILAVVILAAALFVPMMRSAESRDAKRAAAEAAAALQKLARVDARLQMLDVHLATELPEGVDYEAALRAEIPGADLTEADAALRRAEQQIRQDGLPPFSPPALPLNEAGARQALADTRQAIEKNEQLLEDAIRTARTATGTSRETLGVGQPLGMAEYVKAVASYVEAMRQRTRQGELEGELLRVAAEWQRVQGQIDHFRGLDVAPIIAQLRDELTEIAAQRAAARERVETLTAQVETRQTEVAEAVAALTEAQRRREAILEEGFVAGDDASFDRYRRNLAGVDAELTELQEREQVLRHGTLEGAKLVGADIASATLEGGEPSLGLEDLRRQLDTATRVAEKLETSHLSLEQRIEDVTELDRAAQQEIAEYRTRLDEIEIRQQQIALQILEVAKAALALEDEAIDAAESAVNAFAQAQRAAEGYVNAARETQRERDPERKNPRLRAIIGAPYLTQFASSAEAMARLLEARIHVLRLRSNETLVQSMRQFLEMGTAPEFSFDPTPFQTVVDTARGAGQDTLERARTTLEQLAREPAATAWVPLASLAAAYHLSAQVDPAQASQFATSAFETIQQAVQGREEFPYVTELLPFYQHLGGTTRLPGGEPAPDEEGAQPDFFGDEG